MQVHGDERDRKRRSKYKVKYSMQITVTVVEGTSLCRKSMGGPRHLTFLLPPLKPFILREWSWLLSTHSDLVVSFFQRSLCQRHRSISLPSLIGKTMEELVYIYKHCNMVSIFSQERITRIFIISYYSYFLIRRNDRVRALHLLWFRNGGIIEHWLRVFYSPSTMIGLYESGLLLLRSSPFSLLLFFFFCYTKE